MGTNGSPGFKYGRDIPGFYSWGFKCSGAKLFILFTTTWKEMLNSSDLTMNKVQVVQVYLILLVKDQVRPKETLPHQPASSQRTTTMGSFAQGLLSQSEFFSSHQKSVLPSFHSFKTRGMDFLP